MPTYVYKFVATGETIEVQQAFTDDALTEATHPDTGEVMAVKKVFTPVGVTFKGGGFYKTDSRGSGSSSKSAGSSTSTDSSAGSSNSSSDSSSTSSSSSTPVASPSSSSSSSSSSSE
jgi:predicted nucleic acid-binding Zn ribbon protein